ncbi:polysaccharide biosynthesis tyrosine autokinase [Marisediminicola sp. LYQ85]|uniref:polysaccharide biosynthesis tyrosine autokinase n=1 Tax=Marisediminicola sp. LYQ85 TaxID=3391062 RepID=UPI003983D00A
MVEQENGLSLNRLARIVRSSWLVIAATTLVGAGLSYVVSSSTTPVYTADSSVYFSLSQGGSSSELNQGSAYTQAQMLSFARLATSSITLDRVIDDLDLEISARDLARNIGVSIPQNTVVLDITVSSTSPVRAERIANSIASNLSEVVVELAPTTEADSALVSAQVIEPATRPDVQSSPNKSRDTALGAVLGFLLGFVGSVLAAVLETRVRTPDILASITEIPALGQIGRLARSADRRPVMLRNPNGDEAESFRRVRAGLRFSSIDNEVKTILVTSAVPGDGKTTLAVNLSLAAAETGARVLLIDADLRRPKVADTLEVEGSVGLTTTLVGDLALDDALSSYGSTDLDLLLAGEVPPNPSELLSSSRMAEILGEVTEQYDLVVIDSAPVLSVADATLLSPLVDLTLLVVNSSRTRKAQVTRTIDALEVAGGSVSGVVLNRMRIRRSRDAYHYDTTPEVREPVLQKLGLKRAQDRRDTTDHA